MSAVEVPGSRPARVMVVDDHAVFREGLTALIDRSDGVTVVASAGDGAEACAAMADAQPDVILMDLLMPTMNGIEATRRITADHPDVAIVMLTMVEDDDSVFAAVCAGASGYVLKGSDGPAVLRAIDAAMRGEALFGASIARRLTALFQGAGSSARGPRPFPDLTDREREVLDLIAQGRDNAQIARRLQITPKTVSNHVSSIFAKLRVADRAHAIVAAREAGLGEHGLT